MTVQLSEEAERQAEQIDAWWRKNRPAAPDLFRDELGDALALLETAPLVGTPYKLETRSVRRLLLPRTHYHVYFIGDSERVLVVAVWSAFRGREPAI